jgi:hypothetical protein
MADIALINTRDSINIKLSQDEIHERALQSVTAAGELDQLNEEFKSVQKEWKKRIEVQTSKLRTLRRTVENGEEYREVDCKRAYDVPNGKTWLVYEGKRYLERPCTNDELELARQGDLFEYE